MIVGAFGVARGDRRHDRGVDDAQRRDAMDAQSFIDHRQRILPHLAGADG